MNAANGYHGYWAQDIYSVNPNFGTEDDLVALSAAVHARGMYLMVDIVTNHSKHFFENSARRLGQDTSTKSLDPKFYRP